jgi:hypothetical protein
LQKIQQDYKNKGLQVVMVNIDVERFRVAPFLKKNPATAMVLLTDGKVDGTYDVRGIPLNLILDRKGMIRSRKAGFSGEDRMRGLLDTVLSEGEQGSASAVQPK